jgi:hypothetical protein
VALESGTAARPAARTVSYLAGLAARASLPVAWVQIGMLFAAIGVFPFIRTVDFDFWWHLKTGEIIAHSGIPAHDPYSWTATGQPWLVHEWLSELLIYGVQSTLGYWANALLFTAVALASLVVVYALARRSGAGTKPLVLLMLVAVVVFSDVVTVRPQQFSWLLFAGFLYVLERDYAGHRAPVHALPFAMVLWANLHLGFVYGWLLLACWLAAAVLDAARHRDGHLRRRALIVAACVAAPLVNPSGLDLLLHPVRYIWEGRVDRAIVYEWQSPDIRVFQHWPIFITAMLIAWGIGFRGRPRPFLVLVGAAAVALSLDAIRNAPYAAIVMVPVAGGALARRCAWATSERDSSFRVGLPMAGILLMITPAIMIPMVQLSPGATLSLGAPSQHGFPAAAAGYVAANYADRPMLNDYNTGGYLVWKLHGRVPVFVDGRADMYGSDILHDYDDIGRARPDWQQLLDNYHVEVLLIRDAIPLHDEVEKSGRWRKVFTDHQYGVWVRE